MDQRNTASADTLKLSMSHLKNVPPLDNDAALLDFPVWWKETKER